VQLDREAIFHLSIRLTVFANSPCWLLPNELLRRGM